MSDNELNTLVTGEQPPLDEIPTTPDEPVDPVDEHIDETPDAAALQADIAKLEEQRKKAEEQARYWRQQKAEARAEYFKSRKPDEPQTPSAPVDLKEPRETDFDDYSDYTKALTDYRVEVKQREWIEQQKQQKQNIQYQARMTKLQEGINSGYAKYDDFEEVALSQTVPITPAIAEILAETDNPADVAYYLGKNRTEAVSISRMTPVGAARAIAKIETKLEAGQQPAKTTTQAPKPIKPIGSGPSEMQKNPEDMSQAEYEKWREEQGARRY